MTHCKNSASYDSILTKLGFIKICSFVNHQHNRGVYASTGQYSDEQSLYMRISMNLKNSALVDGTFEAALL
jgi:hypothetical protein